MLVLSRRVGEEIVIGDDIRLRVVSIQGNHIRLAFIAPRHVPIHREELLRRERPSPRLPEPDAVVGSPRPDPLGA
jgi:carbon storage regulator